jgi:hypothetical protein
MIVPFVNPQSFHIFGDHTKVFRKKGMMESIESQKDSGTDWHFLAVDSCRNYTAPLPGPPAIWIYRAIYTRTPSASDSGATSRRSAWGLIPSLISNFVRKIR